MIKLKLKSMHFFLLFNIFKINTIFVFGYLLSVKNDFLYKLKHFLTLPSNPLPSYEGQINKKYGFHDQSP